MYDVIKNAEDYGLNRVYSNSREFIKVMEELIAQKENLNISELIKQTLNKTGYTKALELENTQEAENRIENLEEFLTVAIEFEEQEAENTLSNFLEQMALTSDIDNMEDEQDSVTLMTLHSAKGLEFPVVFLVGMEEGIFPGYKSISEPKELEEERRLCYVGVTRAKQNLYLTCAKRRTMFGSTSYNLVSRFIKEISKDCLQGYEDVVDDKNMQDTFEDSKYKWQYGLDSNISKINYNKTENNKIAAGSINNSNFTFRSAESFLKNLENNKKQEIDISKYQAGQRVYHKKFGEGKINYIEEEGNDYKVDITFDKSGHKRLMARYAGLEII